MFGLCAPISGPYSEILLGPGGDFLELSGVPTFYSRDKDLSATGSSLNRHRNAAPMLFMLR
jgi:hypothetical protein